MKNFIYVFLVALLGLIANTGQTYAAFPVHSETAHSTSVATTKHSFEEFVNSAIKKYHRPIPPTRDKDDEGGKTLNIVAIALGTAGALALIAAFLVPTFVFGFGGLAALFGLAAIITGAHGMELSPLKGLGVTGFVLGIVTLSAIVIIGIIAFLLLLLLGIFMG